MADKTLEPQKFSQYFNLNVNSTDLDFLDIYANQDISLFLDPYGISALGTQWSQECEKHITGYFQYLVDSIKESNTKAIQKLLNALHEVDEVALGYSINRPSGRGIGKIQAKEIQAAFENSQAAKSGDIKDIADCALMIPGINRDKISDITSNILKKQLIQFTQEQCKKHNIPTHRVPVNNAFDYDTLSFTSFYADLPVINNQAKILLPISSVRREPQLSKDRFYRNFVIEFLKAEHEHAGDALASVLKNGRIVVRIGDLKKKYPIGSDFLYEFSKQHPNILKKYKEELRRTAIKKTIPILKAKQKHLSARERIDILKQIKVGKDDANNFHKISYDNLIQIFGRRLANPQGEVKINNGRKRIDIVFNNVDRRGFFYQLNTLYHVHCPKIFIECKNYENEIGNPEIDQLEGRLDKKKGMFGILLCRSIKSKSNLLNRCKDVLHSDKGYIIVLEDLDIELLLNFHETQQEQEIDNFFINKLSELIM